MKKGRAASLVWVWSVFLLACRTAAYPVPPKVMLNGKWYYFLPADNQQPAVPQHAHSEAETPGYFDLTTTDRHETPRVKNPPAHPTQAPVSSSLEPQAPPTGAPASPQAKRKRQPVPSEVVVENYTPLHEFRMPPTGAQSGGHGHPTPQPTDADVLEAALREAEELLEEMNRLKQAPQPLASSAIPAPAHAPSHAAKHAPAPAPAHDHKPKAAPVSAPTPAPLPPAPRIKAAPRPLRDGLQALFKEKSGFAPPGAASKHSKAPSKSGHGGSAGAGPASIALPRPTQQEPAECLSRCPAQLSAVAGAPLPHHAHSHATIVLSVCHESAPWLHGFDCGFASIYVYRLCPRAAPFDVPPHLSACTVVHEYSDNNESLLHIEASRTGQLQRHYAAYFRHVTAHYELLTQLTLFLHGALRPGFGQVLPSIVRAALGAQVAVYALGMTLRPVDYDLIKADVTRHEALLGPPSFRDVLLRAFFCSKAPPRKWVYPTGGVFAVSRSRLHMWPRCKYEGLLTHLRNTGPGNVFTEPSSLAAPEGHSAGAFDMLLPAILGCYPEPAWAGAMSYVCMGVETRAHLKTIDGVPETAPFN
eukprot:jgi/Mesvir1/26177/Mv06874-RA.1